MRIPIKQLTFDHLHWKFCLVRRPKVIKENVIGDALHRGIGPKLRMANLSKQAFPILNYKTVLSLNLDGGRFAADEQKVA